MIASKQSMSAELRQMSPQAQRRDIAPRLVHALLTGGIALSLLSSPVAMARGLPPPDVSDANRCEVSSFDKVRP